MFFAIYYECNKALPQILGVGAKFEDIIDIINEMIDPSDQPYQVQVLKIYNENQDLDSESQKSENSIPYEMGNIKHKHHISFKLTYDQTVKMINNIPSLEDLCMGHCAGTISVFESKDSRINLLKVLDSVDIV